MSTVLPVGWEIIKLGDVCQFEYGKSLVKSDRDLNGEYEVYGSNGQVGKHSSYLIKEQCIIVGRKGAAGEIHLSSGPSWPIDTTYFIKENEKFILKYLYYQLKELRLASIETSTAIPGLNRNDAYAKFIFLPPKNEQQKIVQKIEELFSELDKGVENLKNAQQQLKVYRQAVLKWAFEGRLTNLNVSDNSIPTNWKLEPLQNVTLRVQKATKTIADSDRTIRYIDIGGIDNKTNKIISHKEYFWNDAPSRAQQIIKYGDVLFSTVRTYLKNIALVEDHIYNNEIASTGFTVIRANNELINYKYLYHYVLSEAFLQPINELQSGSSYPAVRDKDVLNQSIPLPTIEEQNKIVQEIESRLSVCDKIEETINTSFQQVTVLRQSILKRAFEGKLVKQEIQPIYKPKNTYFYQVQLLGKIAAGSKKRGINHGEITIAKYAYLVDKLYQVPTYYKYERWHLGPYPPEIKKAITNNKFFSKINNNIEVKDIDALEKYNNPYSDKLDNAIDDLSDVFSAYDEKERSHQIELLATVCKVIEDVQSTDLMLVRQSMAEWKIDLKTTDFKNKAEKFSEAETEKCLGIITYKGWLLNLLGNE